MVCCKATHRGGLASSETQRAVFKATCSSTNNEGIHRSSRVHRSLRNSTETSRHHPNWDNAWPVALICQKHKDIEWKASAAVSYSHLTVRPSSVTNRSATVYWCSQSICTTLSQFGQHEVWLYSHSKSAMEPLLLLGKESRSRFCSVHSSCKEWNGEGSSYERQLRKAVE